MQKLRRSRLLAVLAVGLVVFNLSPFGSVLCYGKEGRLQVRPTLAGICLHCVSEDLCCTGCGNADCAPDASNIAFSQPDDCACAQSPDAEDMVGERKATLPSNDGEAVTAVAVVDVAPTKISRSSCRIQASTLARSYCPAPVAVLRI